MLHMGYDLDRKFNSKNRDFLLDYLRLIEQKKVPLDYSLVYYKRGIKVWAQLTRFFLLIWDQISPKLPTQKHIFLVFFKNLYKKKVLVPFRCFSEKSIFSNFFKFFAMGETFCLRFHVKQLIHYQKTKTKKSGG